MTVLVIELNNQSSFLAHANKRFPEEPRDNPRNPMDSAISIGFSSCSRIKETFKSFSEEGAIVVIKNVVIDIPDTTA